MSNRKVYLALYKGKKEGRGLKVRWARFRDWLVRTVTRSPYSHCEIAVTVHPNMLLRQRPRWRRALQSDGAAGRKMGFNPLAGKLYPVSRRFICPHTRRTL